jgi:hypothetical protein
MSCAQFSRVQGRSGATSVDGIKISIARLEILTSSRQLHGSPVQTAGGRA